MKKPLFPKIPKCFLESFGLSEKKTWPDLTSILVGEGENLQIEKWSHFLNLLDFQILSQQVLTRVVGNF